MKHRVLTLILTLVLLLFPAISYSSYTFGFFTDEPEGLTAKKFTNEYLAKYVPLFKEFDIRFRLFKATPKQLNCHVSTIKVKVNGKYLKKARPIVCDVEAIMRDAAKYQIDQPIIITNIKEKGRANYAGGVPMISAQSINELNVILHEWLHSIGFDDEYLFSKEEAKKKCFPGNYRNSVNVAVIQPNEGGYGGGRAGDSRARSLHGDKIPWYGHINNPPEMFIAKTSLGTPPDSFFRGKIGLFKSDTCSKQECIYNKYNKKKLTSVCKLNMWNPGVKYEKGKTHGKNIMRSNISDTEDPFKELAPLVRDAMLARGIRLNDKESQKRYDDNAGSRCEVPRSTKNSAYKVLNEVNKFIEKEEKKRDL